MAVNCYKIRAKAHHGNVFS